MRENPVADISELVQLMYVGLIGANKKTEDILKGFFEEHDMPSHSFLFLEYLMHKPLALVHRPLAENVTEDAQNNAWEREQENAWEISPFINRLVRRALTPRKDKDILEANLLIKMKETMHTKYVHKFWYEIEKLKRGIENEDEYKKKIKNLEEDVNLGTGTWNGCRGTLEFIDFVEGDEKFWYARAQQYKDDVSSMNNRGADSISKKSFEMLYKLLWPQIQDLQEEGTFFFIPIASNTIFYGVIFIGIPHLNYPDDKTKLEKLVSGLFRHAKKHYVPALALIHEHFCEKLLSKKITQFNCQKVLTDEEKTELLGNIYCLSLYDPETGQDLAIEDSEKIDYRGFICRNPKAVKICFKCEFYGWEESSDNVVEKYLHKLWQDRKTGRTDIKKSLFFKNRLYTDPNMLDLLGGFLKPSKAKLKKDDDKVPSVLVVAEAGAGKEDIPKLLKLFSDC